MNEKEQELVDEIFRKFVIFLSIVGETVAVAMLVIRDIGKMLDD